MTTSAEGTTNMLIKPEHSNLLKPYHAIQMFVHEMNELYGDSYKPLAMYSRLLDRTEDRHEVAIQKHVQAFRKFVIANRKAILDKNDFDMRVQKVKYSEHVFVNVHTILGMADTETKEAIWQHLLVLSAMLDANSAAKRQIQQQQSVGTNPDAMLSGIMEMVSNVVNSGLGGADGSGSGSGGMGGSGMDGLNLGGLLGSLGSLGGLGLGGSNGDFGGMLNQLTNSGSSGGSPDLGAMLSQLTNSGIMSQIMNMLTSNIEDGKLDIRNLLASVQTLAADANIAVPDVDLDNPNDSENIESMMSMFEGLGINRDEMQKMVSTMESLAPTRATPTATTTTTTAGTTTEPIALPTPVSAAASTPVVSTTKNQELVKTET